MSFGLVITNLQWLTVVCAGVSNFVLGMNIPPCSWHGLIVYCKAFRDDWFLRARAAGRKSKIQRPEVWEQIRAEFDALPPAQAALYTDLADASAGVARAARKERQQMMQQPLAVVGRQQAIADQEPAVDIDVDAAEVLCLVIGIHGNSVPSRHGAIWSTIAQSSTEFLAAGLWLRLFPAWFVLGLACSWICLVCP